MIRSFSLLIFLAFPLLSQANSQPNLIFILANDLGYGDLGCFGSEHIKTPALDQMAAEGMILSDFYSGSTVCAPSRCVLMTGLHTGNCCVRGNANNANKQTLQPSEITVASELKKAGYYTALFGKWGLRELESDGHPMKHGFDTFYGYLNQRHAQNFYPEFIIDEFEIVRLRNKYDPKWIEMRTAQGKEDDGAGWAHPDHKIDYTQDLFVERTVDWLNNRPTNTHFFLYLSLTIPHANNEAGRGLGDGPEVPDYGIYADKDWPNPDKGQAAMISRMDHDIGTILTLLKKLRLDENTFVIFSSDNGHHKEGGNDPEFFIANGPLKGMKRDMHEGGIRVPTIARWPRKIAPNSQSAHPAYFGDLPATACDLAGTKVLEGRDSISFLPTLTGQEDQESHPYLYWEFYKAGSKQAVRFGDWKAIRKPMLTGPIQLYNLRNDLGEENDLAAQYPEKTQQALKLLEDGHSPSPNWTTPAPRPKKTQKKKSLLVNWKPTIITLTEHPNARAVKRDSTFFPPLSEAEIHTWETKNETPLPSALRHYYLQSNGLEAQKGILQLILPLEECRIADCGCRSDHPWLSFGKTLEADYYIPLKPDSKAIYRNNGFRSNMEFFASSLENYLRDSFQSDQA